MKPHRLMPFAREARSRRHPFRPSVEQLETREVPAVTISGNVVKALNVADPSDTSPNPGPPVAGATVSLDNGAQVFVTGADGTYSFTGVAAGQHTVTVTPPANYIGFSAQSLAYTLTLADGTTFPNLNFALTPKTQAVVQNLYERVLNRPADADGFHFEVLRLNAGVPMGNVLTDLISSTEYQTITAPIANFLASFYTQGPIDTNLLRRAVQLQNLGDPQDAVLLDLLYSPTFVRQFSDTSTLSNTDYVTLLYQKLLRATPTANQLNRWVPLLDQGALNRGEVALGIVTLPKFDMARPNAGKRVGISLAYLGVLGQTPNQTQYQNALDETTAELANRLANSKKFANLIGYEDTFLADVAAYQLQNDIELLSRLQLYNPQTGAFDTPVAAGSLTSTTAHPVNLYFVAHGWAPGFQDDVFINSTPGDPLKVWQTVQFPGGDPASPDSAWLFGGISQVSVAGLAQAIIDVDPNAQVIAYSWIDQSATPLSGQLSLNSLRSGLFAGQSEGFTQLNGLRLARAIELALSPNFFLNDGLIHILGHSHGSKVATVASLALQEAGIAVSQLTLFESPEGGPAPEIEGLQLPPLHFPGLGGAQNFLWYYLQQMNLSDAPVSGRTPSAPTDGKFPTFVDNYYSQDGFGSALGGYPGLGSIADVLLHPEILYPLPTSTSDPDLEAKLAATLFGSHDYPPPWYAQAGLMTNPATYGLGWSPLVPNGVVPSPGLYTQTWTQPIFSEQFMLSGPTAPPTYTPTFTPLQYARQYTTGTATDNGSAISLSVNAATPTSVLAMTFNPLATTTGVPGNGMDFEVQFSNVSAGANVQLVVWVRGQVGANVPLANINAGTLGYLSVPLFVMDAAAAGSGVQKATISLDGFLSLVQSAPIEGPFNASQVPILGFSLIASPGSSATVTVSQMRQFNDGIDAGSGT